MKRLLNGFTVIPAFIILAGILFFNDSEQIPVLKLQKIKKPPKEEKALYTLERYKYEYSLLKSPVTGRIPTDIRTRELSAARLIPEKTYGRNSGMLTTLNLNTYTAAGPDSIGGRTRALAYDKRFGTAGNQVLLSGSVSGGIMRSTDGGNTWTRVSPENDIHALTALAQDPRAGNEDTWYAGGGEFISNSASATGAPYMGFGIWKSTNNGVSWTKLPLTALDIDGATTIGAGLLEEFDNPFDFVHKIFVNPANGHVYVAGHRRLLRSTNGGASWNVVFSGSQAASSDNGQMDITGTIAGKLYLGVNGGFPDRNKRGIFTSTDGITWTRLAGGTTLNVDSVSNWRGNDPDILSRRIIMALAPSNENIMYVTYENGLQQDGDDAAPEVDMFKLDATGGINTWTNLSANMPDFPGQLDGVDPFETQDGYNLYLAVKPDDPNVIFLGGTSLFRSTSGFTNKTATAWIGGYNEDFPSGLRIYPNSHPDFHNLVFQPNNGGSNPNFLKAIAADDGGVQLTNNIMSTSPALNPVTWQMAVKYQTLQYYHVAIDPTPGSPLFIGGAQDNGTRVRTDGFNHVRILSGDGAAAAIAGSASTTFTFYGSSQLGQIYRDVTNIFTKITPNGLTPDPNYTEAFGEFVTYFKLDFDNVNDLYYVNFNRLFRTTNAPGVTSSTWTELTGVRSVVNPGQPSTGTNISIRALELTRGPYNASHVLYIGTTNGRVFRLNDPRNALANAAPVNITPPGLNGTVSDIAVNPNNDDEILVTVSNYDAVNIYWTNNAKSSTPTWRSVEGNLTLPSIRSCMIIVKKDATNNPVTEYYVGTSVGLYSTLNVATGTPTWVREGGNTLNYAVVSSMDYRPQDNTLLIGTHGNGLYYANVGTPDFRPNQNTGVNDPVRNDKSFIKLVFPTAVNHNIINFKTGDLFTIPRVVAKITNMSGQIVYQRNFLYQDGQLNIQQLPKGVYVLTITSPDYKHQHVQRFVKE
jgi:hypothetical protein